VLELVGERTQIAQRRLLGVPRLAVLVRGDRPLEAAAVHELEVTQAARAEARNNRPSGAGADMTW